jgi:hypothetical protein
MFDHLSTRRDVVTNPLPDSSYKGEPNTRTEHPKNRATGEPINRVREPKNQTE